VGRPRFLSLPPRQEKPRTAGLTFAIDGGTPVDEMRSLLGAASAYVDMWKFGWGSSYIDPDLTEKLALIAQRGVLSCPGGTLLEVAALQGEAEECVSWASECGFACLEVSDGLGRLGSDRKAALIRLARPAMIVVAEVGDKDPTCVLQPDTWVRLALADLEAGASWVVIEGRESGTVGLYRRDGTVRGDVVDALVSHVPLERVVFEAPGKDQQAWFIRNLGPEVNLANVPPRAASGLETLRLGLRSDTALTVQGAAALLGP
jgi:phosphosulfolactate synthase